MSTEQELRKELENIEKEIKELQKQRNDVEKLLTEKIKSSSTKFFKIVATPSKSSNQAEHPVCFCSSLEKAKNILGDTKTSYDSDNGITWSYTIEEASEVEMSRVSLESLNQAPSYFPYTGW